MYSFTTNRYVNVVFSNFSHNTTSSTIQSVFEYQKERRWRRRKKKNEKQFETIPFPFPTFIIEATRGVLVGTPCVYGALIGWRVARMPGYLCPEASPPWRKRCFRKRGLPLSADQSSTDPRPRKVVRGPLARARVINRTHCACASRALLSPPLPLFNEYPSSPFATLLPLGWSPPRRISPRVSCSFPFFSPSPPFLWPGLTKTKDTLFRASSMFFRFNDSSVVQLPRNGMLRLIRRLFSFRAT